MKSVLSLLVISLFAIIVYGWSLSFFENHREKPIKLYIPTKKLIDGFAVGGQERITCDNSPCKNNSECIKVEEGYDFNGKTYYYRCECNDDKTSGINCEHKDGDTSSPGSGVGVKLLDHLDELIPVVQFDQVPMYPHMKSKSWNDYL